MQDLGNSYLFARRNDQAIEQLQRTVEMDENFYYAHAYLGRSVYDERTLQ